MKVLVAGFHHETNTFAPQKADIDAFRRGGMFPSLKRGAEIESLRSVNIAIGGFMQRGSELGFKTLNSIWAGATPAAHVTRDTFEEIAAIICADATSHRPDAIYLDLHGAMVTEQYEDGEGELLRRLRDVVGDKLPILASLDLHANVTRAMYDLADVLVAYRTYPHEDMAVTGAKVADLLASHVRNGPLAKAGLRRLPFLIPIDGMATDLNPARLVYDHLRELERRSTSLSLSFAPGFPAADFSQCGGTVWGYSADPAEAEAAIETIFRTIVAHESDWLVEYLSPDEAVVAAMEISVNARRPVIIADTQDNPGAGGTSDTTGLIRALLRHQAQSAAIGLIVDPLAVQFAYHAGVGSDIHIELGGKSGIPDDAPLVGTFHVEGLYEGRCQFEGPMMNGKWSDVGPTARVSIGGVQIIVSTFSDQMLDRSLFRMAEVTPEQMKILVVKSSVHFRADFGPIAQAILTAKSPGPVQTDPAVLPWKNLQNGMRMGPLGPRFMSSKVLK